MAITGQCGFDSMMCVPSIPSQGSRIDGQGAASRDQKRTAIRGRMAAAGHGAAMRRPKLTWGRSVKATPVSAPRRHTTRQCRRFPLATKCSTKISGSSGERTCNCAPPSETLVAMQSRPMPLCGSTIFTFYGPIYDLKRRGASDAFTGTITVRRFEGYHLTLTANTDLTITK